MYITTKSRHLSIGRYNQIVPGYIQPQLTEKHVIFNAASPLPGHITWQADFCHGVFYSAVDVTHPDALRFAKMCIDLDGWVLQFIDEATATQALQTWYDTHANTPVEVKEHRFALIWQGYLAHCAPDTVIREVADHSWKECYG